MKKLGKRLEKYINRTYSNKVCALVLMLCGVWSIELTGDSTVLAFMLMIGIPLFLSTKNWITD